MEVLPPPTLVGELLDPGELPVAFVYRDRADVFCPTPADSGAVKYQPCGSAEKFARFSIARELADGDGVLLVGRDGHAVRAEDARVVRSVARPDGIDEAAKWIHIELSEQALVAYVGDRPIFATLASSGRKGYETPTGTYKVMRKNGSKLMIGEDDVDGICDVEEVPWALFYHRGYAVHGAYWHDDFGNTKSHGCTNIAPADAHFLFWWSSPSYPRAGTACDFATAERALCSPTASVNDSTLRPTSHASRRRAQRASRRCCWEVPSGPAEPRCARERIP